MEQRRSAVAGRRLHWGRGGSAPQRHERFTLRRCGSEWAAGSERPFCGPEAQRPQRGRPPRRGLGARRLCPAEARGRPLGTVPAPNRQTAPEGPFCGPEAPRPQWGSAPQGAPNGKLRRQ
jgi:hypothetical protein